MVSWPLPLPLLFRSSFHPRHQRSEFLSLLPFSFVFGLGLGASNAPGELTRKRGLRVGPWIREGVALERSRLLLKAGPDGPAQQLVVAFIHEINDADLFQQSRPA